MLPLTERKYGPNQGFLGPLYYKSVPVALEVIKKSHGRNRKTIKKEGQRNKRFLSWPQKGQIHLSVILLKTMEVHSS